MLFDNHKLFYRFFNILEGEAKQIFHKVTNQQIDSVFMSEIASAE